MKSNRFYSFQTKHIQTRIQEIDKELFKLRTSYNLIIMGLAKDQASYKYNPMLSNQLKNHLSPREEIHSKLIDLTYKIRNAGMFEFALRKDRTEEDLDQLVINRKELFTPDNWHYGLLLSINDSGINNIAKRKRTRTSSRRNK